MKFIGYMFLLLFVNTSLAVNENEGLEHILSLDVYNPSEDEFSVTQAIVPIFNKSTASRGTAFFISPDRLVTNFHAVCCFRGPVNENLYITTKEGEKVKIDKLIYTSAYHDFAVLKINGFSSDHFLNLAEENNIEIHDDIQSFGYVAKSQDIVRLKGKIVDKDGDLYGGTFNFYRLYGFSGSPIMYGNNNEVAGIIFLGVHNIGYIIPAGKITEMMGLNRPCSDPTSCQANALHFLVNQAKSEDAQAQFILSSLLYSDSSPSKNFDYFLEKDILDKLSQLVFLYSSAEAGYSHSMVEWGRILMNTNNRSDYISAGNYFLQASKQNNILAHFFRGGWLLNEIEMQDSTLDDESIDFHRTEAMINSFKKSASVGHLMSQWMLGRIYYDEYKASQTNTDDETATERYKQQALKWLRMAGNENHHSSAVRLMLEILIE